MYKIQNDPGSWSQYVKRADNIGLPLTEVSKKYMMESHLYSTQLFEALQQQQSMQSAVAAGAGTSTVSDIIGGGTGAVTFNGTNQYFTALNSDVVNWLPGTSPFTIEFFIKKGVGGAGAPRVFSLGYDTSATIGVSVEGGKVYVWPYGNSLSGTYTAGYNAGTAWMHVAICRNNNTSSLFIDGVKKAFTPDTRNINDSINPGFDLNAGVDNPVAGSPNWWAGSFTNFRWDNSAIYTSSSLVVPTSPLSATATTKLLMLGGGASNPVYDATGTNNLVNHGAQWTANTPFA